MEKKKLNIKVKIAVGIIIFIVVLFIGSFVYYKQGIKATSSKNKEVIVTIPKGSSGNDIIKILDKNKLIKSSTCAKIYLKMNQHDFKSNVYILNKKMDLKTIFKAIEGKEKKYISNTKITVLDGQTIPEYASIISKQTGIDYNEIIQKWTDQTYLQKLIKKYWFLTDDILSDGIYYYRFNGPISNFKYFFAVVFNKKHQFMHKCLYEDIKKLEVIAKKNYMSIGSPLAYETYVSDFKFTFKDGQTFYFYWPMILNDDARYIATIVEKKVEYIEDPYNILYAMKQGINLNDYLIGRL